MQMSESIAELAAALAKAQGVIAPAPKDSVNPHFKNHYADLASVWEVCRGPLAENGLSVVQAPEPGDGNAILLRTTLLHTSGQWVASTIPLLFDKASMQSLGSAITYGRRYALSALLGIVASEDDDGNGAGREPERAQDRPSQARPPTHREADNGRRTAPPPARKAYDGPDKAPTSGRALYAWSAKQKEASGVDVVKHLQGWGKRNGLPFKIGEWPDDAIADAHAEALSILQPAEAVDESEVPF